MRTMLGLLALTFAAVSAAQDYPSKPVRMVVGFPPGGGTDVVARILVPRLAYDVIKDFAPVAITAAVPHIVTTHPSLAVNSLKELIAHLKANPGKLTFPSAGNGSMPHLAGEIFKSLAGVELLHVPYKGSGQSMQDLLGGVHLVAFDTMPAASPHVRSGKLRALAVSSAARQPAFPDVPTPCATRRSSRTSA